MEDALIAVIRYRHDINAVNVEFIVAAIEMSKQASKHLYLPDQ